MSASKPTRLIRCRCTFPDGSRCELFVISTGCCAAVCQLLDTGVAFRRISACLVGAGQ